MRLIIRTCSLLVVLAALVPAASASATTATVQAPGGKAGVTSAAWKLAVQSAGTTATVTCSTAKVLATLSSASGSLPLTLSSNYHQTLSGCTTSGVATTATCTSTSTLLATGLTRDGVTPMSVRSLSCTLTVDGCGTAKLAGALPAAYSGTVLTLPTTGQSLVVSGSTCARLPNGTATTSTSTGAALTYTILPVATIQVY